MAYRVELSTVEAINVVYTNVTGKIAELLATIEMKGVPNKAGSDWLEVMGFTSKNDATLLTVLKFIGFVDSSDAPTELWKRYRGDPERVLGEAIRESYADLYRLYPEAHRESGERIVSYAKSDSGFSERTAKYAYQTFAKLCKRADPDILDSEPTNSQTAVDQDSVEEKEQNIEPNLSRRGEPFNLNINVQVTLPLSDDPTVYDAIFISMQKHLLDRSE